MPTLSITIDDLPALMAQIPPETARRVVYDGATGLLTYDAGDAAAITAANGSLPAGRRAHLHAHAAHLRWQRETGGIVVGGLAVPTDEHTRNVLTAAYIKASASPSYSIADWKTAPGTYVTLDAATITSIANAVEAHVQACFSANRVVDEAIDAGTVTTVAEVEAAFDEAL